MPMYFPKRRFASGRQSYSKKAKYARGAYVPRRYQGYLRTGGVYRGTRNQYRGAPRGRTELKFHESTLNTVDVLSTGEVLQTTILTIPQGLTAEERIGSKITIRSLQANLRFYIPEVAGAGSFSPSDMIRVVFVWDKQCNGASCVYGTGAGGNDVFASADAMSFPYLFNKDRFVILKDLRVTLNYMTGAAPIAATVSSASVVAFRKVYKKLNIPIEYSTAAGTIAGIRSNNIAVVACSVAANITVSGRAGSWGLSTRQSS